MEPSAIARSEIPPAPDAQESMEAWGSVSTPGASSIRSALFGICAMRSLMRREVVEDEDGKAEGVVGKGDPIGAFL